MVYTFRWNVRNELFMKLRITLRSKLAMGIVFATVVLGMLVSIVVFRFMQGTISDFAIKHFDEVTIQQSKSLDGVFKESRSFVRHLASQQGLIEYLQKKNPQVQDADLLAQFAGLDFDNWYQAIYVMDKTGLTLTSTDQSFVNQNYGFRDYFKKALSGNPAADAAIGVTSGKFGYFFAHPVVSKEGEILGVVVVKLKTQKIDEIVNPETLGKDGRVMLADEYGVIIQSNRSDALYKSFGILSTAIKQRFIEEKRFNNIDVQPMQYEVVQRELSNLRGEKSYVLYDAVDKRDEIIGVARVGELPFYIAIDEPTEDFMGDVQRSGWMIILLAGVVGCTGAALLWALMGRLIFRPIDNLKKTAVRAGKGNFSQAASIARDGELGELGNAFDVMVEQLKNSYTNLEEKVWERAADFEKYKLAVDGASDHIIITDIDGRIVYANRAAADITGYSIEEMLGNRPTVWGRQMPQAFYEQMWHTIKEEKKPFYGEILNKRKSGERYIAEVRIAPLFINKDTLYGFVAIERDITIQKEVNRAKTEFVSIASHQLRTPLTIINWYIEMLISEDMGKINESQRKYLNQIYHASRRMVDLVNSLLSVSRIDTKTYPTGFEPVDFCAAADLVLKELGMLIEKKALKIVKEYDPQMPLINSDPNLSRVIFQNLLSNAIKYTPEGGTVRVMVKKSDSEHASIAVVDTGYGIPVRDQKRIFQKFFRADNARIKEPDGNGLGLYIVKSNVENAGGTIEFTSVEDQGTTFYITLPFAAVEKKEASNYVEL